MRIKTQRRALGKKLHLHTSDRPGTQRSLLSGEGMPACLNLIKELREEGGYL